jgi:thioesterase domain-containing protein
MRRKFYSVLRNRTKTVIVVPDNTRMIALQTGDGRPFFMVDSYPFFLEVVKLMGRDQPVLSLIAQEDTQSLETTYSIPDEAAIHVKSILAHQPGGPYMLGGCSASGIVAYETAQQLRALGHEVGLLVMFDTPNPYFMREYSHFWMSLASYRDDLNRLHWTEYPGWVMRKVFGLIDRKLPGLRVRFGLSNGVSQKVAQLGPLSTRMQAARNYRPEPYAGRFLLVKRTRMTGRYLHPSFGWSAVVDGKLDVCKVSSLDHLEIFKAESDRVAVAQVLNSVIDEIIEESASCPHSAPRRQEEVAGEVSLRGSRIRSDSSVAVGPPKCNPQVV